MVTTKVPHSSGGGLRARKAPPPGKRQRRQDASLGWTTLPTNWRERLPLPRDYFPAHLELVGTEPETGWARAHCPFHTGGPAALSVHLDGLRGGWRCHGGCGAGDLISFHMKLRSLGFRNAVADLLRWRS
ncbi:MAG: hypothetical protein K0M70_02145 [Arenimonas sp.]|nr:hypothetical protein [Arenimonas sp.]